MERWATNTLRILGIVVTSIIVICGCLLLVLLGQCASHGGFEGGHNPDAGTGYFLGALVLGFGGIWFIAWLIRGVDRSTKSSPTPVASGEATAPTQLAPESPRTLDLLTWALIVKLAAIALSLAYSFLQYQRISYMRHLTIPTVISSAFAALPFALLLFYFVRRHISRAVLAFAFGVPAAAILLLLITIFPLLHLYLRSPLSLGVLIVPLVIDIVIVVLAYEAQQPTGLMLPASSLFTATATSLVYFYALNLIERFVFRNFVR